MQCIDLKLKRAAKHFWIDAAGRPMVSLVFETHLPLKSHWQGRSARKSFLQKVQSAATSRQVPVWALKFPSPFQPGNRATVGR